MPTPSGASLTWGYDPFNVVIEDNTDGSYSFTDLSGTGTDPQPTFIAPATGVWRIKFKFQVRSGYQADNALPNLYNDTTFQTTLNAAFSNSGFINSIYHFHTPIFGNASAPHLVVDELVYMVKGDSAQLLIEWSSQDTFTGLDPAIYNNIWNTANIHYIGPVP